MEAGLTKNKIISELAKSAHGKLDEYVPIGTAATKAEPEFMAHLISWDKIKGQIRDAHVALPVVSLSVPGFPGELAENSFAHLALLGPRELLKAYRFAKGLKLPERMRRLRRLIELYLRTREQNAPSWDRIAIQHRATLKELYGLVHIKPSDRADSVLFKCVYPQGSIFEVVATLKDLAPVAAAGQIMKWKIPFLIALGALGKKAKETDLVLALIERMSPTELVTNTKTLERLGLKSNPALRGAYDKAMEKASKSKANVLKTTRAAEAIEDEGLKEKLRGMQDRQLQAMGVEGNWLVLGDRSPSMVYSVELAKEVAGTLAKMVKGKVWLVFFDSHPISIDVTGLTLDQIKMATKHITAGGSGTSIGCGLQRMIDEKVKVDGIAIVSDGGENTAPRFAKTYQEYCKVFDKEVPVFLYHCTGDVDTFTSSMEKENLDMQVFDLRSSKADYYSLPNLVATMRTNRYSLIDEVMATKLLTLGDVFKLSREEVEAIV
jgi:hypothetical protein